MKNEGTYLFTSESVTEGHPDKVADQISDAFLDAVMTEDSAGRVACETMLTTGLVLVSGEITTNCYVHAPAIVRKTLKEIGYTDAAYGFDYESCGVVSAIQEQSPDIALGVDTGGAGDQGMMFGYASNETPELMPLPIMLAHRLTRRLAQVRKDVLVDFLRPDGKSQVTVEYQSGRPKRIDTIVLSAHHSPSVTLEQIKESLTALVIQDAVPAELIDDDTRILINPTGRFEVGGPRADTGLTGRKIIMDTYGGVGSHGGGAFSGKDPSKVDRSASYCARWVAKNIVAAGLADRCEIQLAYAIGVVDPVSVMIDTSGTGQLPEVELVKLVREVFDLTPHGIIRDLDLLKPIYQRTARNGHFGQEDQGFTWENTDRAEALKEAASKKGASIS